MGSRNDNPRRRPATTRPPDIIAPPAARRAVLLRVGFHERPVRGRRPAQGGLGPRRQRHVAADRGSIRQAPEDQGGRRAAALRVAFADRRSRRCAAAGAGARSRFPLAGLRRRRVRLRRARKRISRPRAAAGRSGGRRARARVGADVLLQTRQGPLPQGAARCAEGGARIGRAQEARSNADRRMGRRARRRTPARRDASGARDAAAQARQAVARMEGARRCLRAQAYEPARAARGVRRDSVDARLSLRRVRRAGVSGGHVVSPVGGSRAVAAIAARRGRGILDRRRNDDRDRRRVLGATAGGRRPPDRDPHRGAGTRDRTRQPARRDRSCAAFDRLHAGAQGDDAARRRRRRIHAGRKPHAAGAVAVRRDRRRRHAASP